MVRFSINRTIFMIITSEHGSPTHCVIYGARTKTNIGLRYILTRTAKPIRNVLSSNPIPHPLPPTLIFTMKGALHTYFKEEALELLEITLIIFFYT